MFPMRHLVAMLRATCSVLILVGLGLNFAESAECRDGLNSPVVQAAAQSVPDGASAGIPSSIPAHSGMPCCPCVHTFPGAIVAVVMPMPALKPYMTSFGMTPQDFSDRTPQPLVPPPIV